MPTQYELDRQERIDRNKAMLESLELNKAAFNILNREKGIDLILIDDLANCNKNIFKKVSSKVSLMRRSIRPLRKLLIITPIIWVKATNHG